VIFGLLMGVTGARMTGDSRYYAYSIDDRLDGHYYDFIEFGHLFWRPLGLIAYQAFQPVLTRLVGNDRLAGIMTALVGLNWAFSLLALLLMYRLAERLGASRWASWLATCALCVSFGFLNYAHSGTPYIPGLACLILALTVMAGAADADADAGAGSAIAVGVALACAVGFWTAYVLAIPMALAFPLIHFGPDRRRWRYVALMTLAFGLAVGLSFSSAILALGIRDIAGVRSWIRSASHGIEIGGVSRMIFGIPRSFLSMGNDGRLFKRYLLHDPYAPVSLADLIRLSLAKIGLFYIVLLTTLIGLVRDRPGRRMLVMLALGGVPTLAFAVMWQGGDVERYMPVYPLVFAAWALVLGGSRPSRIVQTLVIALFLMMTVANLPALSSSAIDRRMKALDVRTAELLSSTGPDDLILTVNQADEVSLTLSDLELRSGRKLRLFGIVAAGHEDTGAWKKAFSRRIREAWDRGGSAWPSGRPRSRIGAGWRGKIAASPGRTSRPTSPDLPQVPGSEARTVSSYCRNRPETRTYWDRYADIRTVLPRLGRRRGDPARESRTPSAAVDPEGQSKPWPSSVPTDTPKY